MDSAEKKRLHALQKHERVARKKGFSLIAGIDEAGRGPLAGPVVAAACIIPTGIYFPGINDSKLLSPKVRLELFKLITAHPKIKYAVGIVCNKEIDRINILQASMRAMQEAVEKLIPQPDYLLVDGLTLPHPIPNEKIIRGDQLSHSIAAASIIAKESRDRLMEQAHQEWPMYDFENNKGYGTEKHLKALETHGPCPIHRKTFAPVKESEGRLTKEVCSLALFS